MSRNRFQQINRFLHLSDDQTLLKPSPYIPAHDRSHKIKEIMAALNSNWQGAFKQYNALKKRKWGVKFWVLSDAESGYIHRVECYTGKERDRKKKHGLAYEVVLQIVAHLNNHHRLYNDNFYTSLPLVQKLRERDILLCGTFNKRRKGFPAHMQGLKLAKGESLIS